MNVSASATQPTTSDEFLTVPTILQDIQRNSPSSALALILCANMAIEKLALFSPR